MVNQDSRLANQGKKTECKTCSESFCWRIWSYSALTCSTRSAHILSAETEAKLNSHFLTRLKALPIMLICLRVNIGLSGFDGVPAGALTAELLEPPCVWKQSYQQNRNNLTGKANGAPCPPLSHCVSKIKSSGDPPKVCSVTNFSDRLIFEENKDGRFLSKIYER